LETNTSTAAEQDDDEAATSRILWPSGHFRRRSEKSLGEEDSFVSSYREQGDASDPEMTTKPNTGSSNNPIGDSDACSDIDLNPTPNTTPGTTPDATPAATPDADPTVSGGFEASPVVHGRVADMIRKPLDKNELPKDWKKRKNYVYPVVGTESLVKIGSSQDAQERASQLERRCGLSFGNMLNPDQPPIKLFKRVENLTHTEFQDQRCKYHCRCGVKDHKEYFYVPAEEAVNATQRWTAFCERGPWDERGNLLPFWEQRLERYQKTEGNVDWDEFVDTTFWDHALFNIPEAGVRMWAQRWLIICLIQTVYLFYMTYPSQKVAEIAITVILAIVAELLFAESRFIRGCCNPCVAAWQRTKSKASKRRASDGAETVD
jgi:hypothetical protein